MQLLIHGKPEKVSRQLCKQAALSYADNLLSKRLQRNLIIRIEFTDEITIKGDCCPDRTRYGREFDIRIRSNMGIRSTLTTLAHEMVHVKQWATGELLDYLSNPNKSKFQGVLYVNPEYWSAPWEIDAYGRELGLYKLFQTERRLNRLDKR